MGDDFSSLHNKVNPNVHAIIILEGKLDPLFSQLISTKLWEDNEKELAIVTW